MIHFHANILELAKENTAYRRVVSTSPHSQLVLMSIEPKTDIGQEVHKVDQILFFVQGKGQSIIDGETYNVGPNDIVVVPAGATHNFKNIGDTDLKLFTIYAPANHKPGTVQQKKQDYEDD